MELKDGQDWKDFNEELGRLLERGNEVLKEHEKHVPDSPFEIPLYLGRLREWSRDACEAVQKTLTEDTFSHTVGEEVGAIKESYIEANKSEAPNLSRMQDLVRGSWENARKILQHLALFRDVLGQCDLLTSPESVTKEERRDLSATQKERLLLEKLNGLSGKGPIPLSWLDKGNGLDIAIEEIDQVGHELHDRDEVECLSTPQGTLAKIKPRGRERLEESED